MFEKIKKMFGFATIKNEEIDHLLLKAEQGDANAQYDIGIMYDVGEGLPIDIAKAIEWYQKAATQGHAKAQYTLGIIYESGDGLPHSTVKAFDWFKKAAEQGDTDALFHLKNIYNKCAEDLNSKK